MAVPTQPQTKPMRSITATRSTLIKALIVVTLLFQVINTAWASNHNCCPVDNPDCVMVKITNGCTACASLAIPVKLLLKFYQPKASANKIPYSLIYASINNHVIWRPPITSTLTQMFN